MKAIGFAQGQLGDLIISTVAARAFKEVEPEAHLTLGVNKRYQDILPLFYQHPYYDNFHVWSTYDGWPGSADKEYLARTKYDIIFSAMPQRKDEGSWWMHRSQTEDAAHMYDLPIPANTQPILNPWFHIEPRRDYVALNFIGGFYAGYPNNKSFNLDKAQRIVDHVKKLGYKTICLGDPREPALENTEKPSLSLFETVKVMLGCKALIGVDSFLTWAAAAYSFPCVSSYSARYYGLEHVGSIQAPNPQAKYLAANNLNEIEDDKLFAALEEVLK